MTEQSKKRSWFRIHNLTAIVLLIVAGAVMIQNMRVRKTRESIIYIVGGDDYRTFYVQGWPLPIFNSQIETRDENGKTDHRPDSHDWAEAEIIYEWMIVDAVFALIILIAVWALFESGIRTWEKIKSKKSPELHLGGTS